MVKHLLIYDYSWWILGQKAKIIQQYHPYLDIASIQELKQATKHQGPAYVNFLYERISTLGLGIAKELLRLGVRVDTSQVGSYNYLAKNHQSYREWVDTLKEDKHFIRKMMKLDQFAVISPKLKNEVTRLFPHKKVNDIRPFVDSQRFSPPAKGKAEEEKFVVGWVGNERRKVKNYDTLYRPIKHTFRKDTQIQFAEATRSSPVDQKDMPLFYKALDLLLITSSNEGGPAPALEAYASGVPVLSTNVGYVKNVAGAKGKSLILNSSHPDLFAEKIIELKNNKKLLVELKNEARTRVLTHFTVEKTIEDWLEILFHMKRRKR